MWVGKTNSYNNSLFEIGIVKAQNFKIIKRRLAQVHMLSPIGIAEKSAFAHQFFGSTLKNFEECNSEI